MVVGSRAHLEKEAIAKRHWYRNFLMRGFHMLVLFVAGGAVKDTQCGFKVGLMSAASHLSMQGRFAPVAWFHCHETCCKQLYNTWRTAAR